METSFNRRQVLAGGGTILATTFLPVRPVRAAEPFRIGALNPITGAGSPYGASIQKTIIFTAQEINAAGGAAGRMFEVYPEDSQTSPEAGVIAAKKLIEVNKVHAIFGTWSSGVTLAVMPLTDAANVIEMNHSGAVAISTLDKKDLVFRFSAVGERIGRAIASMIAKEGLKRVATMAFNNASGRDLVAGAKAQWEKMGNKLLTEVVYEPNRPSYRSELQSVLATNPDVIVMGSYLPDTTIMLREARQLGSSVKFIVPGYAVPPSIAETLGNEATNGLMAVDYVPSLDSPAYAHFTKRYKDVVGAAVTEESAFYAASAFDMVTCTALAIEAAGASADNFGIVAKLRTVSNPPGEAVGTFTDGKTLLAAGKKINYEGASGPLDFDQYGDVNPLFKLSEFQEGKLTFKYMLAL
jgi:branched-chain amino acid transport system substrate-binding protein